MTERLYTPQEIADLLRINIRYVRENARSRKWPSHTFGERTIRFTEANYQTILTTTETPAPIERTTRRRRRTI